MALILKTGVVQTACLGFAHDKFILNGDACVLRHCVIHYICISEYFLCNIFKGEVLYVCLFMVQKAQLRLQEVEIQTQRVSLQEEQQRSKQLQQDSEALVQQLRNQLQQLQKDRNDYYTKTQELQVSFFHKPEVKLINLSCIRGGWR